MSAESSDLIADQESSPSKLHYLVLLSVSFVKFGDSVEFTLPAVITQPVSCELDLSKKQEEILALAQYASAAVFSLVTIPILQRFARKPIILFSLYLSVISVIICAIVPDYMSLLMSRILIGISIAISVTPLAVYISEISPNKKFYVLATVSLSLGWTSGGGWCGFLGYLFLERMGWRWFVLITSVPSFLPPILAFHIFLPETLEIKSDANNDTDSIKETKNVTTSKKAMIIRIIKLNLLNACRGFPCFGSILLVPSILKEDDIKNDRSSPYHAIFGNQFLIVSLLFGLCHIMGKAIEYLGKIFKAPSVVVFMGYSLVITGALVAMVISYEIPDTAQTIAWMCLLQIAVSAIALEIQVLSWDASFFDQKYLPISTGAHEAVELLNGIVGNAVSELIQSALVMKFYIASGVDMITSSLLFLRKD